MTKQIAEEEVRDFTKEELEELFKELIDDVKNHRFIRVYPPRELTEGCVARPSKPPHSDRTARHAVS